MGSSTSKGNISTLLLVVTLLVIALCVAILAELMVSDRVRAGKYVNPYVASQVVSGTIYDRNGRALALDVPTHSVYVKTDLQNADVVSQIIALHTGMTPGEILSAIKNSKEETVLVAKDIPSDEASALNADLDKASIPEDEVHVTKTYARTYPAAFHVAQLIQDTEAAFGHVISPIPEFGQSTTYGKDVYLTIDLDIQYLLDLALQQVYEVQSPEYCIGLITDIITGEVLAATTYPFYDLNDSSAISDQQKVNRALVSSVSRSDLRVLSIRPIMKVTLHDSDVPTEDYVMDRSLTTDLDAIKNLVDSADGRTAIVASVPQGEPKYMFFIGSINPKYHQNSYVMDAAIKSIEQGLAAQSKI